MTWHEQIIANSASLVDKPWITLFMALVALDVITGTAKSVFFHITTSSKGLQGLIKHSLVVIVTLVAYIFLSTLKHENWAIMWVSYYCVVYTVSIAENWGQMNLPLPDFVKKYVYKLSDEYLHEKTKKRKENKNDTIHR